MKQILSNDSQTREELVAELIQGLSLKISDSYISVSRTLKKKGNKEDGKIIRYFQYLRNSFPQEKPIENYSPKDLNRLETSLLDFLGYLLIRNLEFSEKVDSYFYLNGIRDFLHASVLDSKNDKRLLLKKLSRANKSAEKTERFDHSTYFKFKIAHLFIHFGRDKDGLDLMKKAYEDSIRRSFIAQSGYINQLMSFEYRRNGGISKSTLEKYEKFKEQLMSQNQDLGLHIRKDFYYNDMFIYGVSKKFHQILRIVDQIENLLLQNDFMYTKNEIGSVLTNKAILHLHLYDFKNAKETADRAMAQHSIKFGISRYARNYGAFVKNQIEFIITNSVCIPEKDFEVAQFQWRAGFQEACRSFLDGDFKSAVQFWNRKTKEVISPEWKAQAQLYFIMGHIDLGNHEIARREIERLRRKNWTKKLKNRQRTSFKILVHLLESEFDLKQAIKKCRHLVKSLYHNPKKEWDPLGPELLPADQWLRARSLGEEFKPDYPSLKPNYRK